MRDDFGLEDVHAVKAALTAEQVKEFKIPPAQTAKKKSSRYKKFVAEHGTNVFEVEALAPEVLQSILRGADVPRSSGFFTRTARGAGSVSEKFRNRIKALRRVKASDLVGIKSRYRSQVPMHEPLA
jgi:hypothetical protein